MGRLSFSKPNFSVNQIWSHLNLYTKSSLISELETDAGNTFTANCLDSDGRLEIRRTSGSRLVVTKAMLKKYLRRYLELNGVGYPSDYGDIGSLAGYILPILDRFKAHIYENCECGGLEQSLMELQVLRHSKQKNNVSEG